ncbi:MAG: hypothetical protein ABIJ08_06220, partial [Nanoarchaeota archaeon]
DGAFKIAASELEQTGMQRMRESTAGKVLYGLGVGAAALVGGVAGAVFLDNVMSHFPGFDHHGCAYADDGGSRWDQFTTEGSAQIVGRTVSGLEGYDKLDGSTVMIEVKAGLRHPIGDNMSARVRGVAAGSTKDPGFNPALVEGGYANIDRAQLDIVAGDARFSVGATDNPFIGLDPNSAVIGGVAGYDFGYIGRNWVKIDLAAGYNMGDGWLTTQPDVSYLAGQIGLLIPAGDKVKIDARGNVVMFGDLDDAGKYVGQNNPEGDFDVLNYRIDLVWDKAVPVFGDPVHVILYGAHNTSSELGDNDGIGLRVSAGQTVNQGDVRLGIFAETYGQNSTVGGARMTDTPDLGVDATIVGADISYRVTPDISLKAGAGIVNALNSNSETGFFGTAGVEYMPGFMNRAPGK